MTSTLRSISRLSGIGLLLIVLAACGGQRGLTANLTDTSIQMSASTAAAGDITFHIKNTSISETHEFVVIQTDLPADQLIPGDAGRLDEATLTSLGEKGDILVGQNFDLTLKLPAGHYMFICNLPNHYAAGMHTAFTVTS